MVALAQACWLGDTIDALMSKAKVNGVVYSYVRPMTCDGFRYRGEYRVLGGTMDSGVLSEALSVLNGERGLVDVSGLTAFKNDPKTVLSLLA